MNWFKRLFFSPPEPVCWHKAIAGAMVMAPKFPVRLVTGQTIKGPHMQAQFQALDGEWRWIRAEISVTQDFSPELMFTEYIQTQSVEDWIGRKGRLT